METNKLPIYAKIDSDVKDRAAMYVMKCKLSDKRIKTVSLLVEEALDQYMIEHPI